MTPLTPAEIHVLEHATAWRHPNRLYRNRFVTGPEQDSWATCQALCERGLMRMHLKPDPFVAGAMATFTVTGRGLLALEGSEV